MKLAVIRHLAFEDLGLLAPLFEQKKLAIQYYDAGVDDIATAIVTADITLILGGPISAYDSEHYPFLTEELQAIKQRIAANKPTLGICLGAQLMALALGSRVYSGNSKEIGWSNLTLTSQGQHSPLSVLEGVPVLHWHGDTFDIPTNATRLAGTASYPNQASSLGTNILAVQFHAEADPHRIEQWLIGHSCELMAAGIQPSTLRQQTQNISTNVNTAGPSMVNSWLNQLEL